MRTACSALVLLLAFSLAGAAPAPDPGREAVKKLEELKKRLPEIIAAWLANEGPNFGVLDSGQSESYKPNLRVLRRISPDRAKGVILLATFDKDGKRVGYHDEIVTVFLTYADGCWTTERFETVRNYTADEDRMGWARLMLAIDEASEK
jgi:hypothetical protein